MKRKKFLIAILIVVILMGYYYPHQFNKVMSPSEKIIIIKSDFILDEGIPDIKMSTYIFQSGTASYSGVIELFNKYTYRRNLQSLFIAQGMEERIDTSYSMYVYKDNGKNNDFEHIMMSDKGEILINNHRHKIGLLGNSKQKALSSELEVFLEGEIPVSAY